MARSEAVEAVRLLQRVFDTDHEVLIVMEMKVANQPERMA